MTTSPSSTPLTSADVGRIQAATCRSNGGSTPAGSWAAVAQAALARSSGGNRGSSGGNRGGGSGRGGGRR